jgi:hypothetical protein
MDLTRGELDLSPDGTTLRAVLTIADLNGQVPSIGQAADYNFYWTYAGITWSAHTHIDRSGAITFEDGRVGGGKDAKTHADAGRLTPGKPGTIEVDVPLANVGNPPAGARLAYPYGQTSMQLATLNLTIDAAGGQSDAVALPCASAPPAPAKAPASAAPVPLPIPVPISLPAVPVIGGAGAAPAPAPAPKAPAAPVPGLRILGLPIVLGGTPTPKQAGGGLLTQVLHLLW